MSEFEFQPTSRAGMVVTIDSVVVASVVVAVLFLVVVSIPEKNVHLTE